LSKLTNSMQGLSVLFVGYLLAACNSDPDLSAPVIEVLTRTDFIDRLEANGELKSAQNTALNVPGASFEQRQLEFMIPDGSRVQKGEVIARFKSDSTRKELSQQEIELIRNALRLVGEKAQANTAAAQILTEQAAIQGDLELSERYADLDASASWVSKNELLDKLQDLGLLKNKQSTASWRVEHQKRRESAGSEVTLAQRDSVQAIVDRSRNSLAALELRAPHDGVFRLNTNWDGSKLQVGGSTWAGDDFANLPDLTSLVARFSIPQTEASGLQIDQRVDVRLAGTGDVISGKISRLGASASVRSRESPVKYLEFDASFAADEIARLQLTPGMAVRGVIYRIETKLALTVPNTALRIEAKESEEANNVSAPAEMRGQRGSGMGRPMAQGERGPGERGLGERGRSAPGAPEMPPSPAKPAEPKTAMVQLADGSERTIQIGAQGSARSVVLSGLKEGESIRVLPAENDAPIDVAAGSKS
jgi:HlyD family secretion protein